MQRRKFFELAAHTAAAASLPLWPWLPAHAQTASSRTQRTLKTADWHPTRWRFLASAPPDARNVADMARMHTAAQLELVSSNKHKRHVQRLPLVYTPLLLTGDTLPDGHGGHAVVGGYWNAAHKPIMVRTAEGKLMQRYSDCPDGCSLLVLPQATVPGVSGNTVFAVLQFELLTRQAAGERVQMPSPIAVLTLAQHPETGQLRPVQYAPINTAAVHGLWTTCGASLSPWGTHLSSEEYPPDATRSDTLRGDAQLRSFSQQFFADPRAARPYHYGHLPEVTVLPDGSGRIVKHYCTGRISKEVVQVMPDERTVLMGDDSVNGGAFMFIADRPRDLSSGTLYAARVTLRKETIDTRTGAFDLQWIQLGQARSAEIAQRINQGIRARDIMEVHEEDPYDAAFTRIPYQGRFNWVRLRAGQEQAAAFLETHRYAALMGASLGFCKWEGTTLNARDKLAYVAMSYVSASMVDGSGGFAVGGVQAGAVYAQSLRGKVRDTAGAVIASDWVPVNMLPVPALIGRDLPAADAEGNRAAIDRIANPDNLKFSEKLRTLFIGEDSHLHTNSYVWAYQVDTQTLTRLASTPAGAEATGLHAVDDVNGFSYLLTHFQHPGALHGAVPAELAAQLAPHLARNFRQGSSGGLGYLSVQRPD